MQSETIFVEILMHNVGKKYIIAASSAVTAQQTVGKKHCQACRNYRKTSRQTTEAGSQDGVPVVLVFFSQRQLANENNLL